MPRSWTVLFTPFRATSEIILVGSTAVSLLKPTSSAQREAARKLEAARKKLNRATYAALDVWHDPTTPVPPKAMEVLHNLILAQIEMEDELQRHLARKDIRREQGLRAAATAVLLQIALQLRRTELRCTQLAFIDPDVDEATQEFRDVMLAADGELATARDNYSFVYRNYIGELQSRPIKRERLARRLIWLFSFRWRGALDRDAGINDIRQELRAYRKFIEELRSALKIFRSDFLTNALQIAVTTDEDDDSQLIQKLREIVDEAHAHTLNPADLNYPVLISRLWSIRAKLLAIPTWTWSMRWRAYTATLQAWLYLFASYGARANGEPDIALQLKKRSVDVGELASILVTETVLLERPLKPFLTRISMIGRQRTIAGLPDPPTTAELSEMVDQLQGRFAD